MEYEPIPEYCTPPEIHNRIQFIREDGATCPLIDSIFKAIEDVKQFLLSEGKVNIADWVLLPASSYGYASVPTFPSEVNQEVSE